MNRKSKLSYELDYREQVEGTKGTTWYNMLYCVWELPSLCNSPLWPLYCAVQPFRDSRKFRLAISLERS